MRRMAHEQKAVDRDQSTLKEAQERLERGIARRNQPSYAGGPRAALCDRKVANTIWTICVILTIYDTDVSG